MSTIEVIPLKKRHVESTAAAAPAAAMLAPKARTPEQSRALRLAQNRKAARESRRRKKALVEDLQRSVIFLGKANNSLKQHNDDLTRRLLEAQTVLSQMGEPVPALKPTAAKVESNNETMITAATVTSAFKSTIIELTASESAAAVAAGTMTLPAIQPRPATYPVPTLRPGATMQAMSNFQQAAAVAMQAAEQVMKASVGPLHPSSRPTEGAIVSV